MSTDTRFIKVDGNFVRPEDNTRAAAIRSLNPGATDADIQNILTQFPGQTQTPNSDNGQPLQGSTSSTPGTPLPTAPVNPLATPGATAPAPIPSPTPTATPSTASSDPMDNFNLLMTDMLKQAQGVSTADLLARKRALSRASLDQSSAITPEDQRTLSPGQQDAIRSGNTKALQPLIDDNAYQLEKAQQNLDNFFQAHAAASKLGQDWADKMVAPDSVIENAKKVIEANPDNLNEVLAGFNDKSKQKIIETLDYNKMQAAGSSTPANYNGEFAATIDLAANTGGTNVQRSGIKSTLQNFVANGDYQSAYAQIQQATASGLKGTAATQFQNASGDLSVISDLKKAIQDYADAGGNTNIFTGTADKIQTKIGTLMTDPKYASLAVQLNAAFQRYRLNMTGAAFGPQESAEYASVLPAAGNTLDLNLAKITGATNYLNSTVEGAIKQVVGQGGVEIKKYAEGATPDTSSDSSDMKTVDGVQYKKVPGGWQKVAFNSAGNASASNVPQRNNNPGDLKSGGVADKYATGTDSQGHLIFPDAVSGSKALAADLQAKISGNSKYLPANPTIAQLGSVYAKDPNWATAVSKILGVSSTTKTGAVDFNKLLSAIMRQEGYYA